jgi:histidyl-tRNA synthetase
VVIQGKDERDRGVVQIKDLVAGKAAAAGIADHAAYKTERPGQFEVPVDGVVAGVRRVLEGGA